MLLWYHYYHLYSSVPRHSKGKSSLQKWLFPLPAQIGYKQASPINPHSESCLVAEYAKCLVINDFLLATVHKDALIFLLTRIPSAAWPLRDLSWAALRGCFFGARSPVGSSAHLCSPAALHQVEESALADDYEPSPTHGNSCGFCFFVCVFVF